MGVALIIALALSMDAFGVGMAYGLKRIKIPLVSMSIIAMCTALAMGTSMLFGQVLTNNLTVISPTIVGAGILIAIGLFQLVQAIRNRSVQEEALPVMSSTVYQQGSHSYKTLLKINLSMFGLVIQVLKTPDVADMDRSGTICPGESILLGAALALDAFASGMAVTMTGFPYYVIGLVAVMTAVMIWAGQMLVGKIPKDFLSKVEYLPGMVLITIGMLKIL